jgi:phosphoglycerate dehydrogenase-like enzyme
MPEGGVLVNVGRGTTVHEPSLVAALRSGHLSGAALDVVATEPLPPDSPLWDLENVLLSPHTAALSTQENERIVDVLLDNLHRLADGRPLRNVVDTEHFY